MSFRKRALSILLITVILCLCGCGNQDTPTDADNPDNIGSTDTKPVENGLDGDISGTGIYGITGKTLSDAIANTKTLSDNCDVYQSSYKSIEYIEQNEVYQMNKNYSTVCQIRADNQLGLPSDYEMDIVMAYKGANMYPSSLSFSVQYSTELGKELSEDWINVITSKVINTEAGQAMIKSSYDGKPVSAYKTGDVEVEVFKQIVDLTEQSGYKVANYVVALKQPNESKYTAELLDFKINDNPKYGLFNTVVASYSESEDLIEKKIATMYGSVYTAKTKFLSDVVSDTSTDPYEQSSGKWLISNPRTDESAIFEVGVEERNSGTSGINDTKPVPATSNKSESNAPVDKLDKEVPETDKPEKIVYYNIGGFSQETRADAYKEAEKLLQIVTGTSVELDKHIKEDSFTLEIKKSKFNSSWGYPLKLTVSVIKLAGDEPLVTPGTGDAETTVPEDAEAPVTKIETPAPAVRYKIDMSLSTKDAVDTESEVPTNEN